jgi:hypothetical protein
MSAQRFKKGKHMSLEQFNLLRDPPAKHKPEVKVQEKRTHDLPPYEELIAPVPAKLSPSFNFQDLMQRFDFCWMAIQRFKMILLPPLYAKMAEITATIAGLNKRVAELLAEVDKNEQEFQQRTATINDINTQLDKLLSDQRRQQDTITSELNRLKLLEMRYWEVKKMVYDNPIFKYAGQAAQPAK